MKTYYKVEPVNTLNDSGWDMWYVYHELPSVTQCGVTIYPISIVFVGSLDDCRDWLDQIENERRRVHVETVWTRLIRCLRWVRRFWKS